MNPDTFSNLSEENASSEEKIPKINLPPKPMLVSSLPPQTDETTPPAIPSSYIVEESAMEPELPKKTSSFSISLPLAFLAFIAALFAFAVEVWILL